MIPLFCRMKVERGSSRPFRPWFPLFLVWLVIMPLVVALGPCILIAACIMKRRGYGYARLLHSAYPILFTAVWALSGLSLQIEKEDHRISIVLM
jgi:hypothetical protein